MGDGKRTRKRAVRLTPEALEQLNAALAATWHAMDRGGKLTRETRAEIFGVSLVTSERLLRREGVDRPSLSLAFRNVGLVWDESYCEPLAAEEPVVVPPLVVAHEVRPEPPISPPARRWTQRAPMLSMWIGGLVMLILMIGTPATSGPHHWSSQFNKHVSMAEYHYNRAQFNEARQYAEKAIHLAREHQNAAYLSEALRVAGDLASAQGSLEEALDRYETSLRLRIELQQVANMPSLYAALGDTELKLGNYDRANEHFRSALAKYREQKEQVGVAISYRGLGAVALAQRKVDSARDYLAQALSLIEGEPQTAMEVDIRAQSAMVLREEGATSEARIQLRRCLQYWMDEHHPRWIAKTQLQLALVELSSGDYVQARTLLKESRFSYQQIGDRWGVAQCDSHLAEVVGAEVAETNRTDAHAPTLPVSP